MLVTTNYGYARLVGRAVKLPLPKRSTNTAWNAQGKLHQSTKSQSLDSLAAEPPQGTAWEDTSSSDKNWSVRGQLTGSRGQLTGSRAQLTGSRGQLTGSRGQLTGSRGQPTTVSRDSL